MKISITKTTASQLAAVDFQNLPFGKTFSDHMFQATYKDGTWQDARIEPIHSLSLHPATMSLHYGQAIFEGMKASKGADGRPLLFRPSLHAHRMNASARRLCMPDIPEDLFLDAVHQLVWLDQAWIPPDAGSALYIRPTMIATDASIGVRPSSSYLFFIITGPVGPYYPKPVRLYAETDYVRAVNGGTGEAKAAGNYAGALLPAKMSQDRGFDQVLWLDAKEFRYIQESGTMNIFFVLDGKVITPPLNGSILHGITRRSVIELLRREGHIVEEYAITIDEVLEAHRNGTLQEAFGTGTAAVVSQVEAIAYQDKLIELPPASQQPIGKFAKKIIDELRAGTIPDPYGWVVPVSGPEENR